MGADWLDFGAENDHARPAEAFLKRIFRDFIHDAETRYFYQILVQKERGGAAPITLPFRCDSPNLRRFMALRIGLLPDAGRRQGQFQGPGAASGALRAAAFVGCGDTATDDLIKVCGWCKQVACERGRTWLEPEEAVVRLGLFEAPAAPTITHGICPACSGRLRAELAQ